MKNYTQYFKKKNRENGNQFYYVDEIDSNSKELQDFIRKIHMELFYDSLPNDWIYEEIYRAFERLEECANEDEYERAVCDIEPDYAHWDLVQWLHESYASIYVDEEMSESPKFDTLYALISMSQVRAKERIYSYVWEFMNKELMLIEEC